MVADLVPHEWLKVFEGTVELLKLLVVPAMILGWRSFIKLLRRIICEENDKQLDKFNGRYIKTELFNQRLTGVDTQLGQVKTQVEQLAHDSSRRAHDNASAVGMIAKHLDFFERLATEKR